MVQYKIVDKEYRFLVGSSLFKGLLLVGWLFYAFALFNGIKYFQQNTEIRNKAQKVTYEQWLNQEDKGPHSAAHYGFYAYKPVPILSIMDKGMEDFLGTVTWLEAHNQNEVMIRAVDDGNSLIKYHSVSIGFIWQFLYPLILLILTFNAITREKENGTLTMLLSTGIPSKSILLGKIKGMLKVFLLFIFLPQVLILSAVFVFYAEGEIGRELGLFVLLIGFYLLLYFLVVNLSVCLSAILKSSAQVLMVCVGFWVITAFILPRIYGTVAKQIFPTPSSYEFTEIVLDQRAKGMDGKGSYEQFQQKLKDSLFALYKVDKIEDLPIGFGGVALTQSEKRDYASYDKNYGAIRGQFVRQDKMMSIGALASPILAMRNLSFGLSETDIYRHFDFVHQAEVHRRGIAKKMNEDIIKHGSVLGKEKGHAYSAGKDLWKTVENFEYQKLSFVQVLASQWINILTIFLWLGLSIYLRIRAEQNLKPI